MFPLTRVPFWYRFFEPQPYICIYTYVGILRGKEREREREREREKEREISVKLLHNAPDVGLNRSFPSVQLASLSKPKASHQISFLLFKINRNRGDIQPGVSCF